MYLKTFQSPALRHLRLELSWLRSLLEVRLREMQRWGLLPPPDDLRPGTLIYPQEVEARLRADWAQASEDTDDDGNPLSLSEDDPEMRARLSLDHAQEQRTLWAESGDASPLSTLRARFALSEPEYLLLLLTLAPAFDPSFPRLYAYIQNHFERPYPTLALLIDAFTKPADGDCLRRLLDPHSTLLKHQLIHVAPARPPLPTLYQPLTIDDRILRFLEADDRLDDALAPFSALLDAPDAPDEPPMAVPKADTPAWERLTQRLASSAPNRPWDWPVLLLRGPKGVGKRRRARALATSAGFSRLLCVDIDALRTSRRGDALSSLRLIMREAILQDALPCLYGWEAWLQPYAVGGSEGAPTMSDTSSAHAAWARLLDQLLSQYALPLILLAEATDTPPPALRERPVEALTLHIPNALERLAFWELALPPDARADNFDLPALADAFHLTPGQIASATDAALRAADAPPSQTPKLTHRQVVTTIKEQIKHRLGDQARLVENRYQWSDLVVNPEVGVQLRELISRYRFRARVLEQWGLGARFGQDLGLSALFEGPPGTGKTMAASMIASELGLDLYQIDLSKVVNRYIGETEKNLGKIFDEAERSQGMLLFDEADSLFGSRTEVKSSNDRYANLEVNYLLQRIEHFSGVAILTTNFPAGIDEAFSRRLSMRVSFAKPDATERKRLWRSMLRTADLPKGPIDFDDLAEEFDMAGGHIRNAVLRAAFIAASRDRPVDHDLLSLAARIEMKEQGMLVHGNPLHELAEEITYSDRS